MSPKHEICRESNITKLIRRFVGLFIYIFVPSVVYTGRCMSHFITRCKVQTESTSLAKVHDKEVHVRFIIHNFASFLILILGQIYFDKENSYQFIFSCAKNSPCFSCFRMSCKWKKKLNWSVWIFDLCNLNNSKWRPYSAERTAAVNYHVTFMD